ncbi:MAG: antibiotic biosynthesis monooxygenase [Acidobacteria bacterium]|nr:antibiotic biosynthesis monooxygenase [Acidobacteriota bacterium]
MSHPQGAELVILFFSLLTGQAGEDYYRMDEELSQLVKDAPGFVGVKSFQAEDGERLTVVWWKDAETLRQWRELPRHRVAQNSGRERWYQYYRMEVARIERRSSFDREPVSQASEPAATPSHTWTRAEDSPGH